MNKANQIIDSAKQAIIESTSKTKLDTPIRKRVAYVVSHGKSYASNGYAIRTHGIAAALNKQGFDALCFVRPGRPWDFGAKKKFAELQKEVEGVTYIHSPWENFVVPKDVLERIKVMALKFEELFRIYRPEIVLAASNYEVAFPAYIAAKKLGLPFHYEVRGFWEISRLSRDPNWENSDGYYEQVELESFLVSHADKLYTLNNAMVQELVRRGADKRSISLVPNAAPTVSNNEINNIKLRSELFDDKADTFLLGYVGALTDYEGLDTLLQAIASLKDEKVKLLVVGGNNPVNDSDKHDEVLEKLKKQAIEFGLQNQVVFTGRVAHDKVGDYIRAVDACVVPRKPDVVCELVSALKPLEYMAFSKPIIASNVAPQAELLKQGKLGWLYEKGSVESLAQIIIKLRNESKSAVAEKVAAARALIDNELTWEKVVKPMVNQLVNSSEHYSIQAEKETNTKVACIMDDFTFQSYSPEANLYQLTPENYLEELANFEPELLFIESAWRGKDDLWGSKVGHRSTEVINIVEWCKQRNIPTVFWNKEDPIHFETFLNTAKLFDFVFTTDIDCIHRYKAALGHDNVFFLPFACQPKSSNPIEKYDRKDAFCFAGAYYVKYPDRTKDLESFVDALPSYKPLEIYDRNFGKDDPNYMFPDKYKPHIVGTLPFSEIDKAYKGYKYAINLNSIKQSQTMFARRVYELLACNTITVSNFSRGVRALFGDLVQVSDNGSEIVRRLETLASDELLEGKYRLAGLRKVLSEHTYSARFNYIMNKVNGTDNKQPLPSFTVITMVESREQFDSVLRLVSKQTLQPTRVVVIFKEQSLNKSISGFKNDFKGEVNFISLLEAQDRKLKCVKNSDDWVVVFDTQDYYGPNYLMDIALSTRYSSARAIGKSSYFIANDEGIVLQNKNSAYKVNYPLSVRRCALSSSFNEIPLFKIIEDSLNLRGLSIDSYNYCRDGLNTKSSRTALSAVRANVNDGDFEEGMSLSDLQQLAESIQPTCDSLEKKQAYSAKQLFNFLPSKLSCRSTLVLGESGIEVNSPLEDGKHEYIYFSDKSAISVNDLKLKNEKLPLHLEITPGLKLSFVVLYLSDKKQKLSHDIIQPNKNNLLTLPEKTHFVKFGLRVYQGGNCTISKLLIDEKDLSPENILGKSETLLIANNYPSYEDLYRNGFVHSRVKAYKEVGVDVDVFRFQKDTAVSWHEFQDIDVTTGSKIALNRLLSSGRYKHVLVHFLDAEMWDVLSQFVDKVKVTIWVHGADIQPWYRRKFNISTLEQKAKAVELSDRRMAFWKSILKPIHPNMKLVFVSNYFAEEVMEDLGFRLPQSSYEIINNPIDTKLFKYREKPAELRKKILSIRPYASKVYANDITVKCILELSDEPFFNELEFRIIGDGALFEETVEPVRKFSNVIIEQRFLSQTEIAEIHKYYGVFLCPSRMDTQGVSRDEAMSSGLVPITSAVAAIPEFLDSKKGFLIHDENVSEFATAVKTLFQDVATFQQMSRDASISVQNSRSKEIIVKKELLHFQ
ncbi:MAG TPA: methyltransferase type 12 [Alteromonas macleodii]|nr:methyltransferase type 12 [Alteromonas macleodii]|tara:strand:+ start:8024 stop:12571 length:4548 start_codon:yes stop_codon:yes gene_type:complete